MPNETDFLNSALARVGAPRITAIDEGSIAANYCQVFYVPLRQSLLRGHYWNFAETRAELALNVTPPLFEFAFSYNLPADCLRVKEFNGAQININVSDAGQWVQMERFKIEGRMLYTNDGIAKIVYIKDISNPDQWDAMFYQAASWMLASDLAAAIPKDPKMASEYLRVGMAFLEQAMAVDGQEGTVTPMIVDDLTWGR